MSDEPIIDGAEFTSWRLDITNHIAPWESLRDDEVLSRPVMSRTEFEATLTVDLDREAFDQLVGQMPTPTCTVEIETDHNPWHRKPRRIRACLWWTIRKRVLRRSLVETTKITIPNCQIKTSDSTQAYPPLPNDPGHAANGLIG